MSGSQDGQHRNAALEIRSLKFMKRKYISANEYFDNVQPGTQISFGTISPFTTLNLPPEKTVFVAWYGNTSFGSSSSIAIGTVEVCRRGDGTVTYDFDQYPIYTTGTVSVFEVVGPQKPPYHWSSNIPSHLQREMPRSLADDLSKK